MSPVFDQVTTILTHSVIGWCSNIEKPLQSTHLHSHLKTEINVSTAKCRADVAKAIFDEELNDINKELSATDKQIILTWYNGTLPESQTPISKRIRADVAKAIFYEELNDINKELSATDKQIDILTSYNGTLPESQTPMSKGIQLKVTKNDQLFILRKQNISSKNDYFYSSNAEEDILDGILIPLSSDTVDHSDSLYKKKYDQIDSFLEEASKRIKPSKFDQFLRDLPIIGPFYTVPIIVFNIGNSDFHTQILKYKNTLDVFFKVLRTIGAKTSVEVQKCEDHSKKDILQRKITIINKLESLGTRPIINAEEEFPEVYKYLNYLHTMFDQLSEDMSFKDVFETPHIIEFFKCEL